MYPHEKSESNKKYIIFALIFHIVIIISIFMYKGMTSSNDTETAKIIEAPPESSIINSIDINEINTEKLIDLESKSLEATTVDAKEVDDAIRSFNEKQENEKLAIQKEKQDILDKNIQKKKEENDREQELLKIEKQKKQDLEKQQKDEIQAALDKKQEIEKQKIIEKEKQEAIEKQKKIEKEQELKAENIRQENIKKAKEENERKRQSLEALKKESEDRQKELQEKLEKSEALKKLTNENKGYNSSTKSISRDEQLAFLREYRDNMYNKVYGNWLRPSYSKKGWDCKVNVTQSDKGEVMAVKIVNCQGDNEFKDSVKKAIFKSSPLPLPKHKSLFDNTIEITFKVT